MHEDDVAYRSRNADASIIAIAFKYKRRRPVLADWSSSVIDCLYLVIDFICLLDPKTLLIFAS